jgi:hypothetical protein
MALAAVAVAGGIVPTASAQQPVPKAEVTAHPAIVAGRILAPDKKGLEEAEVLLDDSVRAVTDRKGYFEIDPVPAGMHDVLVRKMGFVPLRFRVAVTAGDLWDGTIRMDRAAQALPAVVVLESSKALKNYRPRWIDGFVDRRRVGLGTFLDRIDIENAHLARRAPQISLPGRPVSPRTRASATTNSAPPGAAWAPARRPSFTSTASRWKRQPTAGS